MKILNAAQIKAVDQCSIELQNIQSWELMERAASVFTDNVLKHLKHNQEIHVYCGKGNNGGDGLVTARLLAHTGFNVNVIIIEHTSNASEDFKINYSRLENLNNKVNILHVEKISDLNFCVNENCICIDAILGSGVNKPTDGIIRDVILFINQKYSKIFSIDVPSGIFLDKSNHAEDTIIRAHRTFTFQLPKLSFLFPENADFVGNWEVLDIGLSKECIEKSDTNFYTIDDELIKSIYVPIKKVSAKWDYGHCLIIAGSNTMRGAAVLCTGAALKSGCGLVTLHSVENVISSAIQKYPECLLSIDEGKYFCKTIPDLKKYNAIAIGSGMGNNQWTYQVLTELLQQSKDKKVVIDADGLNVMAEHKECLKYLHSNVILTPHIKEFDRLFGKSDNHFERLQKAIEVSKEFQIVIVLKSAYTAVVLPTGKIYFNTIANSGLSKGGSGDVLTGIITSLCAKNYSVEDAAILGVYLHSLAGKIATENLHPESVLSSDIINHLSQAFSYIDYENKA